jgi:ectoine hydroxylase-related dioxygenase (phytanoyl-CoA dioxygenase family)
MTMQNTKKMITESGFATVEDIYTPDEVAQLVDAIEQLDSSSPTFRKSNDVFAIRQFLKEAPQMQELIFNEKLRTHLDEIFGTGYFVTKSIYFDKPAQSNWFVAYHQDLTISVNTRVDITGYDFWTVKHGQFAVQPPIELLQGNFTIRIHLDDTDENNGALKVVPKSHCKGIYRPETIDWKTESEVSCSVKKGGMMIMKPLLLHSSSRTTNNQKRRVIHVEFSNNELPKGLLWSERLTYH